MKCHPAASSIPEIQDRIQVNSKNTFATFYRSMHPDWFQNRCYVCLLRCGCHAGVDKPANLSTPTMRTMMMSSLIKRWETIAGGTDGAASLTLWPVRSSSQQQRSAGGNIGGSWYEPFRYIGFNAWHTRCLDPVRAVDGSTYKLDSVYWPEVRHAIL